MKAKLWLVLALLACLGTSASAQSPAQDYDTPRNWNVEKTYLGGKKANEILVRGLSDKDAHGEADRRNAENDPTSTGYFFQAVKQQDFNNAMPNGSVWPFPRKPSPAPRVVPRPRPLTGSTFTGSETLAGYSRLSFALRTGRVAVMRDTDGTVSGSWDVDASGSQVTLRFYGGRVVYRGVVTGNALSGTASNGTQSWAFSVQR